MHKSAFEDAAELSSPNWVQSSKDLSDNGAASKQDAGAFGGFQASGGAGPTLSVDALEKMLEDPTVQKMVYPYLPEEMRNPETFKWMLQNLQYRQQLQDMLVPRTHRVLRNIKTTRRLWMYSTKYRNSSLE